MVIRLLAPAGLAITLLTLSVPVAMAQSPRELLAPTAVVPLMASPPAAKIVVDPPLAEPLSRGVVFINYRTEHVLLVPVFGPKALALEITLVNPNHQPLGRSVVEFVIPPRHAPAKSH